MSITVGTHKGNVSRKTDAAIATRFLLGKVGTDEDHIAVAGVADQPIGVITDEAAAAEADVNVALLGAADETRKVVASEVIAAGADVYPAANGKVRGLTATPGTYYKVGVALVAAAADGDPIEIVPCVGQKTVVT